MAFELDHLFICTDIDAPEADGLIAFGLTEGTPNLHPGQGTANRRFFFHNVMLELLWVHNSQEAQSTPISEIHIWERWVDRKRGACPFGFCLRSTSHPVSSLPFSTWEYHPPYLPESLSIPMGRNSNVITEPMLFYLSFGERPDNFEINKSQPLKHTSGLCKVTRVKFVSPYADKPSTELKAIADANLVDLSLGEEYLLELGFDRELQQQQADFRPVLPLVCRW
ncbi:hypothetical protein [Coleofasciculus sp. FACHB-129]|uniref:hypothetical protein n=1 Tax=Cyanophyceae TaxID=3028117 RepID=UPI001685207D|nr:hypothetical protein [Coleofasciculus sp. FACHB-129]MBD1895268.1 hypothetical protein [Coleofasciculus sp. FACHB-129]